MPSSTPPQLFAAIPAALATAGYQVYGRSGSEPAMEFRILGPLEVVEQERALPLGGTSSARCSPCCCSTRTRSSRPTGCSPSCGATRPRSQPRRASRSTVPAAQDARGGPASTRPPGYALRVDPAELDLGAFERLRAAGRLGEALALWRGPPYADLAYEPCVQAERARLEELRLAAIEERVDADLEAGRHADLIGELQR